MTDKFNSLREKLLTHALEAFSITGEIRRDKVEEALKIYGVLAAAPDRINPPEDVKLALSFDVSAEEIQKAVGKRAASGALCGHAPKLGASCVYRYTDSHMMPFDVGPMTPSRQCLLPKAHPTDVHSAHDVFWTSSGEAPKTVTLTHTRALVDVAEVGPGKAPSSEWQVPKNGWYAHLHDVRKPGFTVPRGTTLRGGGVVAVVTEETVVPAHVDSYKLTGTLVPVDLDAGVIPTEGAPLRFDHPVPDGVTAYLSLVRGEELRGPRVKVKAPGAVLDALPPRQNVAERESAPAAQETSWYVVPDDVAATGAEIQAETPLTRSPDVIAAHAVVTKSGTYKKGEPIPVRLRPGVKFEPGEELHFFRPPAGVSPGVTLRRRTPVTKAGWYLLPVPFVRALAQGIHLAVSRPGPTTTLNLTVARPTEADAPIPVAGAVDLLDLADLAPAGTDVTVVITFANRAASFDAILRYLTP